MMMASACCIICSTRCESSSASTHFSFVRQAIQPIQGFTVHVLSDCITSYDLKKLPEMLAYYENKGCEVKKLIEYR